MAFVVDLLTGEGNRRIERENRRLTAEQLRNFERMARLFDTAFGQAQGLVASGAFDPERLIRGLEAESRRAESKHLGNIAGAARTMGYRPGDTTPLTQLRAAYRQHQEFRDKLRYTTPADMAARQIGLFASVPYGGLSAANQAAQQLQHMNLSQMTNPLSFFAALMPYLSVPTQRGGS